jgi:chromosomal replication initiator protein
VREYRTAGVENCPMCQGAGTFQRSLEFDLIAEDLTPYVASILRQEADSAGIKVGDILGPSRTSRVLKARYRAACMMRDNLDMPLKTIGMFLGRRDHSTIIHEIREARRRGWYENE